MYKNFSFVNNFVSCHEDWDIFKFWVPVISKGVITNFGDMAKHYTSEEYIYISEITKELTYLPQVAFEITYQTGYPESLESHNRIDLPVNRSLGTKNKLYCKDFLQLENRLMLISHLRISEYGSDFCLQLHGRHVRITDEDKCADLKKVYNKIVRADSIDLILNVKDYV